MEAAIERPTDGGRVVKTRSLITHDRLASARVDDFPVSGPLVKDLSDAYHKVRSMALTDGEIAIYSNGAYVFVNSVGYWVYMRSSVALRHIADKLGLEKVTVNFAVATMPYVVYAESVAKSCAQIPPSVCYSTWRLRVSMRGSTMIFEPISSLVQYARGFPASLRITGLCVCPIQIRTIPTRLDRYEISRAEQVLGNVLTPPQLRVLMWVIGNGLVDPVDRPRVVYLYGGGGDGKSVTINTLIANLRGCISPLSKDYAGREIPMSEDDLDRALSSRFVTYGDVSLKDNKINSAFWKLITGGDTIQTSTGQGRILCTAIMASNNIWYPGSAMLRTWFTRRTVALVMNSPPLGCAPPPVDYNDEDVYWFTINCIRERLRSDTMPVTLEMAFITIFGRKVAVATRSIIITQSTSPFGCMAGTHAVSLASGIPYERLVSLFESMSTSLITEYSGIKAIAGITCYVPGQDRTSPIID